VTTLPPRRRDAARACDSGSIATPPVQLSIVGLNIAYAIIGVILMYGSYRVFDLLSRRIDFQEELQKGNIAVAIVIGSIFIAIAMIVSGALG
jgi:putative membrane protein